MYHKYLQNSFEEQDAMFKIRWNDVIKIKYVRYTQDCYKRDLRSLKTHTILKLVNE